MKRCNCNLYDPNNLQNVAQCENESVICINFMDTKEHIYACEDHVVPLLNEALHLRLAYQEELQRMELEP